MKELRHGTVSGYTYFKCRCEMCKAAMADYQRHRRGGGVRAQSGWLPENTDYRDTGCDLHSACLTCPLPVCRYDKQPVSA